MRENSSGPPRPAHARPPDSEHAQSRLPQQTFPRPPGTLQMEMKGWTDSPGPPVLLLTLCSGLSSLEGEGDEAGKGPPRGAPGKRTPEIQTGLGSHTRSYDPGQSAGTWRLGGLRPAEHQAQLSGHAQCWQVAKPQSESRMGAGEKGRSPPGGQCQDEGWRPGGSLAHTLRLPEPPKRLQKLKGKRGQQSLTEPGGQ